MQPPPSSRPPTAPEHLTGVIERVTFHSPETGFAVLQVQVRGKRDLVPVVGTLPEVRAGEWVEATGRWAVDPTHGQQFRADVLKTAQPDTVEGMQKYLASGLTKGIGPKFAGRMVDAFGLRVFDVIEQSPDRLTVDETATPDPVDLEVEGNFLDYEYTFTRSGRAVAVVSKRWFTWADTYGVDVAGGDDDVLILCCTVVIDLATEKKKDKD